ncbi:hypothetical protein T02_16514 [Trichinella nativa]|uniref:Uncharacterized protein n=1 Tax=Trichinella nativa TaxID=6335 RepID=A0A0V1KPJ3_9BILA|nr:hypothetical protein T02_16514 [Trichinella nativa]
MITFKSVLTSICSTVLDSTMMVHLIDLYVVWTKDFVPVVKSLSGRRKEMRNLNTKCSQCSKVNKSAAIIGDDRNSV